MRESWIIKKEERTKCLNLLVVAFLNLWIESVFKASKWRLSCLCTNYVTCLLVMLVVKEEIKCFSTDVLRKQNVRTARLWWAMLSFSNTMGTYSIDISGEILDHFVFILHLHSRSAVWWECWTIPEILGLNPTVLCYVNWI